jgi:hypothetical protein
VICSDSKVSGRWYYTALRCEEGVRWVFGSVRVMCSGGERWPLSPWGDAPGSRRFGARSLLNRLRARPPQADGRMQVGRARRPGAAVMGIVEASRASIFVCQLRKIGYSRGQHRYGGFTAGRGWVRKGLVIFC